MKLVSNGDRVVKSSLANLLNNPDKMRDNRKWRRACRLLSDNLKGDNQDREARYWKRLSRNG